MNIKKELKKSKTINKALAIYKEKSKRKRLKDGLNFHGRFIDRSHNNKKMCMVLAGYKEYLYPAVFGRLIKYLPSDIDVCVITSGKYSEKVIQYCEENDWSYLSTKENNVSLVQNVAIHLHPNAEYIYKLDEDIFLTNGYFEKMLSAYEHAEEGDYQPGVVAPILPINGYGYIKILEEYNLKDYYKQHFEEPKITTSAKSQIETNPDVATFLWGEKELLPSIDEMNKKFEQRPLMENPCPIRFSIGAILFKRTLWEEMGHFSVDKSNNAMGVDETEICTFCCIHSKPIMVSENIVVGHLAYGPQNKEMTKFYKKHRDLFLPSTM